MLTLAIAVLVVTLLYLYGIRTFSYWAKKGVKHDKPIPFFGNALRVFAQSISPSDHYCELYDKYNNEKFYGYFMAHRPTLVLRDPELIKSVLATDFNYFYSRGVLPKEMMHEKLSKNLFFADGDLWKLLRQRMTPAFTSGKLKAMFPLIVEKTENLIRFAEKAARECRVVDLRDLMARYTTDFIGAVGFGIDSQSMTNENSAFRQLGKRIFVTTWWDSLIFFLKLLFPNSLKGVSVFDPAVDKSITEILHSVTKQRNHRPSERNDFIDQLMELKLKGKISVESVELKNPDGSPKIVDMELDEELMVAQLFIFFAAGFETSSSSSSYTLHQLAFNPEAQRKCQQEIDEVLSRYDNKLCYEAVNDMKYLDLVFKEGIRMWPSLGFLQRRCEKPYRFPGTDLTIDRDVDIVIPVHSLQNDGLYFPEPDEFVPERFLPDNKQHHKFSYLPFGEGPRACIGKEGIRMWPSLGFLQRRCEKPYRFPGTDLTIDRDVDIVIPVHSLQNDGLYFPEPDEFVPERFLPDNKQHHKFSYLPFGEGPRACIGERLGKMQSLAGLAAFLSRFSVEPSERSIRKPPPDPASSAVQSVLGGIPLRIVERKL